MQRIEFSSPLANARNYQPAQIKVEPQLPFSHLRCFSASVLKDLGLQFFRSGRGALYAAAMQLKKPGENIVLLPAYHCPALVEPFIAAGYQIEFYPLQPDLTVDMQALQACITVDTTHCLMVRYFGNSSEVSANLAWLQSLGLTTFDDCAHDLQSFLHTELAADAAICSVKKFIASSDGGALRLKVAASVHLRSVPLRLELKNILRTFLSAWQKKRSQQTRLMPVAENNKGVAASDNASNIIVEPVQTQSPQKQQFRYFQSKDKEQSCYLLTKWLFAHTDLVAVLEKRQRHSQLLLSGLAKSPLGQLLWQQPHESFAPYVIPFLLNDSSSFDLLRKRGLQIYRWEELATTNCVVSQNYRHKLIQIPCHQDLTISDIGYIIECFMSIVP